MGLSRNPMVIWLLPQLYMILFCYFFLTPSRRCQLIKTISVSCVTWCSVPPWWHGHTMKAKSIQKIFVNKVFCPQVSVNCSMENILSVHILVNCVDVLFFFSWPMIKLSAEGFLFRRENTDDFFLLLLFWFQLSTDTQKFTLGQVCVRILIMVSRNRPKRVLQSPRTPQLLRLLPALMLIWRTQINTVSCVLPPLTIPRWLCSTTMAANTRGIRADTSC